MSTGNSREVLSNQQGIHEKLDELVERYRRTENQRPVSDHTRASFDNVCAWLDDWQGDVILDSCCGVGESTANLAERFPDARVIGIDKSALRVDKHVHYQSENQNYAVFRADVNDFWRLARTADWNIVQHFLLYPNPYPKPSQVQKRWYASAAMVDIMALCSNIEVRSNWFLYLMEFARAASHYDLSGDISEITGDNHMTPFERKYRGSGQPCWRLNTRHDEAD
ncbi:tRNA (guanine(46)-N(7))-methyltransferase TrmB [Alteromonas sp. RKMC-009]|uniref:tRNA (guanine(46)-N(7))-methyltransferase TrmB n=1 Tax=Alteromonas sp. RKMC-009 TaxID=2267264 RepID=UPI000E67E447|nr:methyltransferase domain-containing protein [Alteromonas sp. RKMC-009]AYA63026.1 methyltransferase domain-containing protein [Alteromonas sp. RKMC-009]